MRKVIGLSARERQLAIAAQILMHRVFRETLALRLQSGEMPDRQTVMRIMKRARLYHVEADSTYRRRASTVTGWVNWMVNMAEE